MNLPARPDPSWRGVLTRLIAQVARFGAVGGVGTLIHVAMFSGLIELFDMAPLLANLAAFCTAVGVSFAGHYHWTFADKKTFHREVPKMGKAMRRFLLVSLIGLSLNSLVVYVIVNLLAWSYWYAVVLMVTAVPAVVFLLSRFWAFRGPVRQAQVTRPG